MRVAIVGNGPSAEGMGEEIDGHDFVVRMRAFWLHAAEHAGDKIDAHAYFGWAGRCTEDGPEPPWLKLECEHWFTKCPSQVTASDNGPHWLAFFAAKARMQPVRLLSDSLWNRLQKYLSYHPSTGIVAVAMALAVFPDCRLSLYGYDSTTPEGPNYWDARQDELVKQTVLDSGMFAHNTLLEKRAIAEIDQGLWLGRPTQATLHWPSKPDLEAACKI